VARPRRSSSCCVTLPCQVMLVSLPEETPVNELIETAYRLRTSSASHSRLSS